MAANESVEVVMGRGGTMLPILESMYFQDFHSPVSTQKKRGHFYFTC